MEEVARPMEEVARPMVETAWPMGKRLRRNGSPSQRQTSPEPPVGGVMSVGQRLGAFGSRTRESFYRSVPATPAGTPEGGGKLHQTRVKRCSTLRRARPLNRNQ